MVAVAVAVPPLVSQGSKSDKKSESRALELDGFWRGIIFNQVGAQLAARLQALHRAAN